MKSPQTICLALAILLGGGLFSSAHAAVRTVYFNQSGMNRTSDGLSSAVTPECKITISNPSSQSQSYTIVTQASSINVWSNPTLTVVGVNQSCLGTSSSCPAAPSGNNFTASGTLAASQAVTVTYTYTDYPTKLTTQNSSQHLRCAGSITATDTGNPGFLIASGVLITFIESARMNTDAVTGGTSTFGGIAVYTQVPIAINRSKPF